MKRKHFQPIICGHAYPPDLDEQSIKALFSHSKTIYFLPHRHNKELFPLTFLV
ncbi:hypothetical protein ALO_18005 [Acetonema longum DSM 6540]|uniref:Uncharacterized protein n=1 Tax=Acetonema longum DSM 6540 TaxID=1009370 RepID=F7NNB6_9FIRM|nr:hypothetical protein ALO_18005 [Acetonema longum DSM 6540]